MQGWDGWQPHSPTGLVTIQVTLVPRNFYQSQYNYEFYTYTYDIIYEYYIWIYLWLSECMS